MRLKRCTRGLILVSLLVFSCALVLDDPAVLLAGTGILAGLLALYLYFCHRFAGIARTLAAERSLSRSLVRKGTTLRVSTGITVTVPACMQAIITDRVPVNAAVQDGKTSVTAGPGPSPQTFRLSYRITPMVHGQMAIAGITLKVSDPFFEDELELRTEPFCGPTLSVQPSGIFEPSARRATLETREIERMSVHSGLGIRSLREYYAGDDLRRIDWKLSAKHDKLFVREYNAVTSFPPLIIVDLPWKGAPYPLADFDHMVTRVAGMVNYSIRTYQYVSVLIISGPNILYFIADEKDLQHCISTLREWMHPAERVVHFYHAADRADLRSHVHAAEAALDANPDPATRRYLDAIRTCYLTTLENQKMYAFTGQVARTLASVTTEETFIFSLVCGDTSHIRQISRQAKTAKLAVHLRIPESIGISARTSYLSRLGADSLEVFA